MIPQILALSKFSKTTQLQKKIVFTNKPLHHLVAKRLSANYEIVETDFDATFLTHKPFVSSVLRSAAGAKENVSRITDGNQQNKVPSCFVLHGGNVFTLQNTVTQLKAHFLTACIPIIFLYNNSQQSFLQKLVAAGVDDFINITSDEDELLLRIEMNIGRAERNVNINPLTKLPGNFQIKQMIEQGTKDCVVLHIDIDNFKNFNDTYGFLNGDEIIKKTATLLANVAEKNDFLGHIGGDDFVVITKTSRAKGMKKKLRHAVLEVGNGLTVTVKKIEVK